MPVTFILFTSALDGGDKEPLNIGHKLHADMTNHTENVWLHAAFMEASNLSLKPLHTKDAIKMNILFSQRWLNWPTSSNFSPLVL
jgi:hypothetical protein